MDSLENYKEAGLRKGSETLLNHADALEYIRECHCQGITILGMDFYRVIGERIVETLSPADFSDIGLASDAVEKTTKAALRLIEIGFPDEAQFVSFVVTRNMHS